MPTRNVVLTDHQADLVERLVASGRYQNASEVVWCQEEPQNQGAWYQTAHYFRENMREDQKLYYAGRPASASPAGGYVAKHNERQKTLVEQAFGKYK